MACKLFEQAANHYEMDNQMTQANRAWEKWADLKVLLIGEEKPDFAKLIKTYEKVGMKQLSQALAKSLAKDYFFKAVLCYLANQDLVGCKSAL